MPIEYCENCNAEHEWRWEEAFDKFGFNDGDGLVMTRSVENTLEEQDYKTESIGWGMHNFLIISIKKNGIEKMPTNNEKHTVGYTSPRLYLPREIINLLDDAF